MTETAYTKPWLRRPISASRSSGVAGEASRLTSMPGALSPASSSSGRSGTISPVTPAARRASAKPGRSAMLAYVLAMSGMPTRMAASSARTDAGVAPRASAASDASWIVGPSTVGSENGSPTSIRSAPASSNAVR